MPNAELRVLRGIGHLPMIDDAELTARTILEFTARPGVRGSRPSAEE